MKLLSVIVPIYNTEVELRRCIDSILNQKYKNLEVILVNDGSIDQSLDICIEYKNKDNRVKIIDKENGGLSSARNAGIKIATGEFITFVDSDDKIEEEIYSVAMNELSKDKYDVLDFEVSFNLEEKVLGTQYTKQVLYDKDIILDYLKTGQTKKTPFSVCRKVYKKKLFNEIKFPIGKINEDIATNFKLLSQSNAMIKIDRIGYYYIQEGESITRKKLTQKDFDLIDASLELEKLANDYEDDELNRLAAVKVGRSYFSLLAKIAYYGIDDQLDKKEIIKYLTINLRKYYKLLITSEIQLNRKVLITLATINFELLNILVNITKKIGSL